MTGRYDLCRDGVHLQTILRLRTLQVDISLHTSGPCMQTNRRPPKKTQKRKAYSECRASHGRSCDSGWYALDVQVGADFKFSGADSNCKHSKNIHQQYTEGTSRTCMPPAAPHKQPCTCNCNPRRGDTYRKTHHKAHRSVVRVCADIRRGAG